MFKVGQKVWCLVYGAGIVYEIVKHRSTFTVGVEFPTRREFYTLDGRITAGGNRVLFFSEPKIVAEKEPPFEPTMIGRLILIQGNNCIYRITDETDTSFTAYNQHNKNTVTVYKQDFKIADITDLGYKSV